MPVVPFKANSPGGCTNCGCTPTGGGGPGVITGCTCQGTPATLSVTVVYSGGQTAADYLHAYQDGTLTWFTMVGSDVPGYLASANYSGVGYYSASSWVDDFGRNCYYRFGCNAAQYTMALGQFSSGSHDIGTVRTWNIAGSNTCIPFSMTSGTTPGGVPAPRLDVIG